MCFLLRYFFWLVNSLLIHVNYLLLKYSYYPSFVDYTSIFLQVLVCCRNGRVYSLESVLYYFLWTLIYFPCCCLLLLGALFLSSAIDFNSKQVQLHHYGSLYSKNILLVASSRDIPSLDVKSLCGCTKITLEFQAKSMESNLLPGKSVLVY